MHPRPFLPLFFFFSFFFPLSLFLPLVLFDVLLLLSFNTRRPIYRLSNRTMPHITLLISVIASRVPRQQEKIELRRIRAEGDSRTEKKSRAERVEAIIGKIKDVLRRRKGYGFADGRTHVKTILIGILLTKKSTRGPTTMNCPSVAIPFLPLAFSGSRSLEQDEFQQTGNKEGCVDG
ncbi:uncharacterized protein EI97DRAFT_163006 [Westerdykella ornata]|uniref:Uncharacterized protein n=1 Tax=Westerdykella ornata TaxID=318751 RepID=A0A6A6J9C7_WESOR|nr:uncharacterized protein EI97DRAFT_163006 [Westerdykella ornata]KAF2273180.1 hypothetical protein EI97DRAFT_163006 [Westerdykella ornata]